MGGGFALKLGVEDPRVAAVVMYYGKLITEEKTLDQLKAPLAGFFGEEDRGIPADSVKEFEAKLQKLHKRAQINIYPKAGHAFANPENPGYTAEAAQDAWNKTLIFLKANLAS
jgi:carboxymethylenebutenolidase